MPVQTSYLANHLPGFEGQEGDFGLRNKFTRACELAAGINFGRAVVRGTADDQATLPTASGQDFMGFTNYTSAGSADGSDEHLYQQYTSMNIMDYGPIWLYTEQSVVPGDRVFFRHTARGGNTVIGRVRKDADVNTADEVQNATFESTTSAGAMALVWLRGNVSAFQVFETTTLVAAGALSLVTDATLFDTTLGAATSSLADGYEGQLKYLEMIVNGGDMVVTPANLFNGTTLTFNNVGDAATLVFRNGAWHVVSLIGVEGVSGPFIDPTSETITAVGPTAISLLVSTTLFDTTLGAATSTLADGQVGQVKRLKMITDGGDMVVTPANIHDATTLTFTRAGDYVDLIFLGTTWYVTGIGGVEGVGLTSIPIFPTTETLTVAGANVVSVATYLSLIDTTLGAATGTLADGEIGQIKTILMTVDGGDMVITPANLADGTTLTFSRVGDFVTMIFTGTEWHVIAIQGVQGLSNSAIQVITPSVETLVATPGPETMSVVTAVSFLDTTAGAGSSTLADGSPGQLKTIYMSVDGGTDHVVTPANLTGGTTLTFADVNDFCTLMFIGTEWRLINNSGVVIA
jgi:hypothetical protein